MQSTDVPADPDEGLERVAIARGLLSAAQAGELRVERQAAGEPLRLAQQLLRCRLVDGPQLAELLRGASRFPRRLGRYEVLREIGRGGMGVVYEALDPTLGRSVAIKLLVEQPGGDEAPIQRLRREAQLAGQLSHPGIINVHEVACQLDDETGRQMTYIVMDHVPGPTLDDVWEGLPFERRIELLRQVAAAMAEAHRHGVIHRDLKPSNILVSADRAIVTDFGLARGAAASTLTCSEAMLGTPAYMSPEQVLGHNERLDARTDVWSLGVMLYLLATGVPPFRGNSSSTLFVAILHQDPLLPRSLAPGLSRDLEAICLKTLAKRAAQRYADAAALAADLDRWAEGRPVVARRASALYRLHRWAARNKAAVAATAGILLALVLGLVGISYQLRQANMERKRAEQKERQAEKNLRSFTQMSDVKLLAELVQRSEEKLWPPVLARIPAMERWLVEARELAARLVAHRKALEELQRRERLDRASAWRRDVLQDLVPGLVRFAKQTVADVERRIPLARKRHELSVVQQRDGWASATRAIRAHPRYGGLVLLPQEGLVPLGPDPASTLWEFAEVSSGRIPRRDESGKLQLDAQSAIVLVLLPRGAFRMGGTRFEAEGPVHGVRLDPFFIGKHEVTQGQWLRVMGENPSSYSAGKRVGGRQITLAHPVEQVSWHDCRRMLLRIGLVLPSEAQWEYAARGGTRTEWWCGKEPGSIGAGRPMAGNVADASYRQAGGTTQSEKWTDGHAVHAPIGSFRANAFGLHDCVGNVWEWCRDEYFAEAYKWPVGRDAARRIPADRKRSRLRSFRGGGWGSTAVLARSANRDKNAPANRDYTLGLRPARLVTK